MKKNGLGTLAKFTFVITEHKDAQKLIIKSKESVGVNAVADR